MILPLLIAAAFASADPAPQDISVCVYYDADVSTAAAGEAYRDGELHGIMLANLLGHFREAKTQLRPAGLYRAGELERCARAAYIGSRYDAELPEPFLVAVSTRQQPFLWINYNVWRLRDAMGETAFRRKAGFEFRRFDGFADVYEPGGPIPDFYRDFRYKGQTLRKLAYVAPGGRLVAAPEIARVRAFSARVLAEAANGAGETTPYVVENLGFFYVADNPFLFIHESDRYLVLADLLFDFLGLPPRQQRRYALARLEDIHPNYPLPLLYKAIDTFRKKKAPFAISLIPRFEGFETAELTDRPEFLEALRYAQANGGEILLHGYTHQISGIPGCPALPSGADFEFWDRCAQRPLAFESEAFVHDRLDRAQELLRRAGLPWVGWVTPHYSASPRAYALIGRAFDRVVHRGRYGPSTADPADKRAWAAQFFPYTIYRDYYGQFVWPENLGYVALPGTPPDNAGRPREWSDLLEAAKAARVVRDSWASFFIHPQFMAYSDGPDRVGRFIDDIRAQGYEFVSLKRLRDAGE